LVLVTPEGQLREVPLEREADGFHSITAFACGEGDRYWFRLDGELTPDVASRFQPDGVFGPSQIVNPDDFHWTDRDWRGVSIDGQVVYEMHVGTFTPEGTWQAAASRLPALVETGITILEVMPVAEFPGRFGWGYDGVFPYAPTRAYGCPNDFRAFVDTAHGLGLAVILDVVYNHLGPDGCAFTRYSDDYFTTRYENEWGKALNFDGPGSAAVRDYFACNAAYWIDEFHLDGLRLDATQSIHDASAEHIVKVIGERARAAAGSRSIIMVSENEPQQVSLVRPVGEAGFGLDALWNDDFHHSAVVALTGRNEAYYSDHRGTPQELISAAKRGYLFQGQRYAWQKKARGSRTDGVCPSAFVTFIENHDQLANSGDGSRLHARTTPGRYRAMTALLLLMPGTPMLFQGQEFGATTPFLYFADHEPKLAAAVREGRAKFVAQFPSLATDAMQSRLAAPDDPRTFESCRLNWNERTAHATARQLHIDLLSLRRREPAFRQQRAGALDGAVLGPEAFVLRFETGHPLDERVLIVNLGADITAGSFAEPLLAPPDGCQWSLQWSSEHPAYAGLGAGDVVDESGWRIPGHSASVLRPMERTDGADDGQ
jgi:maltooligosyltrehalose trehalohydrolase